MKVRDIHDDQNSSFSATILVLGADIGEESTLLGLLIVALKPLRREDIIITMTVMINFINT
jgi:hypothetical protein